MLCAGSLWEDCLLQAAPYIQLLIDLVVRDQNRRSPRDAASGSVPQIYASAARSLLSQFVWFDILGIVSTGNNALLGINHVYLLDSKTIHINEVSGCHNLVAETLCKIASLRRWKIETECDGKLNILELATRGGVILRSLTDLIDQVSSTPSGSMPLGRNTWTQDCEKIITIAYARAAIIYLHVVISGPAPHLEEIRREVAELTASLESLNCNKTLQYASWPLCVIACFAVEEKAQNFLHHVDAGEYDIGRSRARLCMEGLKIGSECQKIRREYATHSDWMSSMKSLQRRVLLG